MGHLASARVARPISSAWVWIVLYPHCIVDRYHKINTAHMLNPSCAMGELSIPIIGVHSALPPTDLDRTIRPSCKDWRTRHQKSCDKGRDQPYFQPGDARTPTSCTCLCQSRVVR